MKNGFRVYGLGFRVQGLGFRVQGLGFRVYGLGFRVGLHVRMCTAAVLLIIIGTILCDCFKVSRACLSLPLKISDLPQTPNSEF